jgi:hypothetical protein
MPNHIDLRKLGHAVQVIIAKQSRMDQSLLSFLGHVELGN